MNNRANGISADELDRLTVDDIRRCRYIKMKDGEHVTDEQFHTLRDLVHQADEAERSHTLDANTLNAKLHAIPSSSPTSSRSVTPERTDETVQAEVVENYNTLIAMGGRPGRSLNFNPGPWDPSGGSWEKFHVRDHWSVEAHSFMPELRRWTAFRKYQQDIRANVQRFPEYQLYIRDYRNKHGLTGPVDLCSQSDQQTKIDEWKEYQVYIHRKLRQKEDNLKKAELELESTKRELQEANTDSLRNGIQSALPLYQAEVGGAEIELKEWQELLEWIGQQLLMITRELSLSRSETNTGPKRSRRLRNNLALAPHKAPRKIHSRLYNGAEGSQAQSTLRPQHDSKISKTRTGKRLNFVQEHTVCDSSKRAFLEHVKRDDGAGADPQPSNVPRRRSKRISSAQKFVKVLHRPLHSPRISKATTMRNRNSHTRQISVAAGRDHESRDDLISIPAERLLDRFNHDADYTEPTFSTLHAKAKRSSRHAELSVRRSERIAKKRK